MRIFFLWVSATNTGWFIKQHNNRAGQEDTGVWCVVLNDLLMLSAGQENDDDGNY